MRRLLFQVFLASIALNALLGIWALLVDDFGQLQGKVLATSLLVSAAMLSVLLNAAPMQRQVVWPVPVIAAAAGAGSFALLIVFIWAEVDNEEAIKVVFSGLTIAAGASLAGLLALLPLRPAHVALRYANGLLILLLVAAILIAIWWEVDAEWYARLLGILSVLVAATTLAVPVVSRFGQRPAPTSARDGSVGQLVTAPVVSVEPGASLRQVVEEFIDQGVSFVVVEASRSAAGVVTERDVLRALRDGAELDDTSAADVMSTDLIVTAPDATIEAAARLMIDNGIRHVLVGGPSGGVLSIHQVLAATTTAAAR